MSRCRSAPALLAALLTSCTPAGDHTLPGTLERHRLELVADATEAIVEMPVAEGDRVKRGTLLLAQDDAITAAQLEQARAQVEQARARLDEARNGPRATTIHAAIARRDGARSLRDDAVRERDRLRSLVTRNLVSRAAVDQQAAVAANAEASLRAAEAELKELQQGTRPEEIDQAVRSLEQAQAQLDEMQTTKSRLEVRAPRDVIVDALPYRVGEKPQKGATVAVLLETGAPFARIHVPEPMRPGVKVGEPATIRIDGVPGTFNGHVRYVSSEAEFTPYYALTKGDRVRLAYRVEVLVDGDKALDLPAGLPLEVTLQEGTSR